MKVRMRPDGVMLSGMKELQVESVLNERLRQEVMSAMGGSEPQIIDFSHVPLRL